LYGHAGRLTAENGGFRPGQFETQPGYASGGVVTDWGAGVDSAGAAVGGSMNPSQYDGIPRGR
jgi:hypothetical protein